MVARQHVEDVLLVLASRAVARQHVEDVLLVLLKSRAVARQHVEDVFAVARQHVEDVLPSNVDVLLLPTLLAVRLLASCCRVESHC